MTEEWEQYRVGQAESWLGKVRSMRRYAEQLEGFAAAQYAHADNLRGIDYSRPNVSTSPKPDAIAEAVIRHEEIADSVGAIADNAKERVKAASAALYRMPDLVEARCLHLYYVEGMDTWERVCVEMGYSYDGMMKLRRRALCHAYDVMPHSEREPMHAAL